MKSRAVVSRQNEVTLESHNGKMRLSVSLKVYHVQSRYKHKITPTSHSNDGENHDGRSSSSSSMALSQPPTTRPIIKTTNTSIQSDYNNDFNDFNGVPPSISVCTKHHHHFYYCRAATTTFSVGGGKGGTIEHIQSRQG